ncbi:alpha/beta hydrolase [Nonomuraea sp. NPDC047897]|uniref:alpha/beta hydrolase n=1 Tax=Nonomuraea sp. NPDC047897 TaxID=3364346 RepID=UPI0037114E87
MQTTARTSLTGLCSTTSAPHIWPGHSRTEHLSLPSHGELDGRPPLLLAVGAKEVLLDDARRFAEAVSTAGGNVYLDIYDGMPHALHATVLPIATTLLRRIAEWINQAPLAQDQT